MVLNKYTASILLVLIAHLGVYAQLQRPFSPRYTTTARGSLVLVSNNILTSSNVAPPGYTKMPASAPAINELPPGTGTGDSVKNDKYVGAHIDIDSDPSTPNSSSADLALPTCNTIAFAGLYWGAGMAINQGDGQAATGPTPMDSVTNWNRVKLKIPGATGYTSLTASVMDTVTTTFHGYQGFVDVTALVQAGGSGTYTLADVKCPSGKVNTYGGWTIVVVYEDSTQPVRNLTVFDGMAIVNSGSGNSVNIKISGFQTPPIGNVAAQISAVCYDGDRAATDGFSIKDTTGAWVDQTTSPQSAASTSKTNDAWNSSITNNGTSVTTRNPAHANTMGYDADLFTLYNTDKRYLRNRDTAFEARINSNSEGFVLGMMAVRIDNFQPELILEDSVSNLSNVVLKPADTLVFTSFIRNIGSDSAQQVAFADQFVPAFRYIPNSIRVNGIPMTDAAGDDVATYDAANRTIRVNVGAGATATTGGTLRLQAGDTARISYRFTISTNCEDIGTSRDVFYHNSQLTYKGQASGNTQSATSRERPGTNGCLKRETPRPFTAQSTCVPLPLRLLSFEARLQADQSVQLQWSSHEDGQTSYYELYRSADGRQFQKQLQHPASAIKGVNTYFETDVPEAGFGTVFYQVQAVHADGSRSTSPTVTVQQRSSRTNAPRLYPNPATRSITLERFSGTESESVQIRIYNQMGQEVLQLTTQSLRQEIGLEALPNGLYVIRYETAGQTYRLPFLKQ
jgi:uncharacterized repeat protein (TIGR01451 family)